MKSFLPLLFCGAALLITSVAHAKDKPLEASKDNFVSLQWNRSGGFAGVFETYVIQNRQILKSSMAGFGGGGFGGGQPGSYLPPHVAPLSENQWKQLIEELQKANVPAIAGDYKQEGLADGFSETLRLTLSDSADLDQTFTLDTYGGGAPASYYKFTAYLSDLLARKFGPAPAFTSPNPATTAPR